MTKTNEYKISVITAVYNVEEYLEEMIESIIAQTIGFENVQLILVDDGSKDGSGNICDKYALQYSDNILVVHKENGGVSSARNEGLKHIKGKYVNFTDADDMLEENALEMMYEYLKENEEQIDLVAIRMEFFGARERQHVLDYKFERTRIVDLEKEYNAIQLSVSSTLIKKECFNNRYFDAGLSYAEDAQLVVDILLDKMCYGIVCGTKYLYRKRVAEDSSIDSRRQKAGYYIPYMERFILHSLENAKNKKGYIPQFVQYTCMYDLQWCLSQNQLISAGAGITKEEGEKYKSLILKSLQYIDNNIIKEQKNISNNYKTAILLLKKENQDKKQLVFFPDDIKLRIWGQFTSAGVSSYTMFYEFIHIYPDEIIIEGYVRYFVELDGIEVILKAKGEKTLVEYKAELFERMECCSFCMDEVITQAKGFRFNIKRSGIPKDVELQMYLRYHDTEILCGNIAFRKFFPLSTQMKSSYLYDDGILLTYSGHVLNLSKTADKEVVKECERKFQEEIMNQEETFAEDAVKLRKIYHVLKRIKRKEIWLISDRISKADDNGEAFFTYMNTIGKKRNIRTYFVLDKASEDYERLCKIGKVVSFNSAQHKLISLLCDKIISSQANDYVFNPFLDLSYLYKDITHQQKFVCLKHGVTKDDQSRWLRKTNKNISLLVTVTHDEYQSILQSPYYYGEKQVKCTGFPRYDYLSNGIKEKKVITFMPTWRSYLASDFDIHTDSRILKKGIEDSPYCRMYGQVFSNDRLYKAAEKYHYVIKLMWHPEMPRECMQYFNCGDSIEILGRNTRYKEIFAESNLIVTDYSSAVFDFAYLHKPVIYYQQDADEFYSGKHTYDKGYFDYERDGFGEVEYTAEALVDRVIEYMENDCQLKDVYRTRIEKTFPYNDRNNCKRVYEEIIKL
ncbi:MAG: glycosyltransferase [Lachnospiraceae bacterium]|nr:glycosyltransferase [Lachnospiraceae bacterium]